MRTDGVQMDPQRHLAPRARRSPTAISGHYLPEKPRHYETKAKNAQEAHEAIRPTDFAKDRYGSGDEARLYELIWKRALASQMASASLERTTVTLRDGTGQHELRATGQVVKFPGFLAVYEEGRDQKADARTTKAACCRRWPRAMRRRRRASMPRQHFTQPPPRYSEASLVKRLEELGIGRPSTYAVDACRCSRTATMSAPRKTASSQRKAGDCSPHFSNAFSRAMSPMISPPGWRTSSTRFRAAGPSGRRCSTPSGRTSSPSPTR